MAYFVFLEFTSQRVNYFLEELRSAFDPESPKSPAHITVRGPYSDPPDPELIEKYSNDLRGHGINIKGAGRFKTKKGFAVYLRAESNVFRDIWWKPDYTGEMKPHITIYESNNKKNVELIYDFLNKARISIRTFQVELSIYTQKQNELFGAPIMAHKDNRRAIQRDLFAIDDKVLIQAKELGKNMRAQEKNVD